MNTQDLVKYFAEGEKDANELLNEINPNLSRRFKRACKDLAKIVDEVRTRYPEANIYVNDDVPALLLGDSHETSRDAPPQQEMVACESPALVGRIGGGGW